MKQTKVFIILLFSLLFIGSAQGREIVDLAGRTIKVPEKVERIVALGPGTLRLVVYLQATSNVVGIETLETKPLPPFFRPYSSVSAEQIAHLPQVGSGGPGKLPNLEALLACRAQVIFSIGLDRGQVENLQAKTGIPTIILSYGKLGVWRDEALQSLKLMGDILNRQARAHEIALYLEKAQKELHEKTAAARNSSPSVYFGGLAYKGIRGLESTEEGYFPGTLVKARNVAGDNPAKGHLFIDKERLLQWNPEIIFLDYSSNHLVSREYLENICFYQLLQAVKQKRVYSVLPYNQYNTNLESALANAYYIGNQLYPENFSDLAVTTKIAEIFDFFLGLKIDTATLPAYQPFCVKKFALR
ncbi:MAG: iron ABC transporter substrate-binding protein [Deltaproteobacteria bacterium]|nr:iron ABC transporter substrate-binding protein [Candidatus Tharpella aukensis]